MLYKHLVPFFLMPLMCISQTQAAVTVGATRVVYKGAEKEANLTLSNKGDDAPFLVQSWVSRYGDDESKSVSDFIVTPPLFRLDTNEENILRIIRIDDSALPKNQESLFLLNVKAIPALSESLATQNVLQIALKTTIKLFYRPLTLKGEVKDAVQQLKWSQSKGKLSVRNDSGFNIVVDEVKINGLPMKSVPEVISPFCTMHLQTPAFNGDNLSLSYIDEYGSSNTAPSVVVH
ncbi:molecular chaperone [Pseudomonas sp. HY7a-MNA-CIBAN-0227]|uniref:fimbrial biogenesis chaperone n=1 Tax=Pseudomonas sp. HY7a-MNA-CIBAN-0227 TaxID=3140474 RepID=UPI003317910C